VGSRCSAAAEFDDAGVELGLEHEGQKTAKHVAADGCVQLVVDREATELVRASLIRS
jgi:hypothetical protein